MKYLLLLFVICCLAGCSKSPAEIAQENDEEIQTYLKDNNLEAKKTDSGLYYLVSVEGNGQKPTATSSVKVNYNGFLTNGESFDSGDIYTSLQNVIKGWTEGIPYFSEGGEGMLFIPAHLGYGNNKSGSIPANSVLIFNIKLLKVVN